MVNARDAMPTGGKLIIETCNIELDRQYANEHVSVNPGRYAMLAVSDSGVGMSPETEAHIFEPFFTTKGGSKGTGLGLATAYGIVKQSSGYIWVYSEPGHGTTFKIYLPIVTDKVDTIDVQRVQPQVQVQRGTETILLVEDDEAVRGLAETILISYGYKLLVAQDAEHALQLAELPAFEVQLVLTDVVMPRMRGPELGARLKVLLPNVKVVYMTGYIEQAGFLEDGVFLQKPFSREAVVAHVTQALIEKGQKRPELGAVQV